MTHTAFIAIELLENRKLMSGNVLVKIKNDRAVITGDDLSNSIVFSAGGVANDHFVVTGVNGTTVNGKSSFSVEKYPNDTAPFSALYIKMGGGNDTVNIAEVGSPLAVSIDLGEGDDRLDVPSPQVAFFRAIDIYAGGGDDKIYLSNFTVQGRLRIYTGAGTDYAGISTIQALKGFDLVDTGGRTRYTIDAVSGLRGPSTVTTGNSEDFLTITRSHIESLYAKLNGGDDRVTVLSTFYDGFVPIDGGTGNNVIDNESYVREN